MILKPEIPEIYLPFLQPSRYKTASGGRNSLKSWTFATLLITKLTSQSFLAWCTREIQEKLKDSVHKLLKDTVQRLGAGSIWDITEKRFKCLQNDSEIIFSGLRDLNSESIKSTEAVDICWCEEAQGTTQKSLDILLPTIRKPGSEVWFSLNPKFPDDPVYNKYVIEDNSDNIKVIANYCDVANFCSPEILKLAEECRLRDPEKYRHIWLGEPIGQGGLVYPMYNKSVHVIDFDLSYLAECNLYMSIDPHRKYYPAITWYAVTPSDAVVVYNEYPKYEDCGMWYDEARTQKTFDLTIEQLANIILAGDCTLHLPGKKITRTGDPRFLAEAVDLVPQLQEKGVHGWKDAPFERIETQRERLKSLLAYNPALPLAGTNSPSWYISRECRNKDRSYRRHCYDEERDKETEQHKDFIDNDRYFLSLFANNPCFYDESKLSFKQGAIKSLAQHQMELMPAKGYFQVPKQK